MYLIVTVDTEEDIWDQYQEKDSSASNIERIPVLQRLFDTYEVKPSYVITYPVARNEKSIRILKTIFDDGRCEIGTHVHPWNTPPFEEEINEENSMLCNLPSELQLKKIEVLHEAIIKSFGFGPSIFKAGRWAFNHVVAKNIVKLGYKIDTSITPYIDWSYCHGSDYSIVSPKPYKFHEDNILTESPDGKLLEIPVTIEYLQSHSNYLNKIVNNMCKNHIRRNKVRNILKRFRLLSMIKLSPETTDLPGMIKLTNVMLKRGIDVIHMWFHSSSLKPGLTPFVRSKQDEDEFICRIEKFLMYTHGIGIKPLTHSGYLELMSR